MDEKSIRPVIVAVEAARAKTDSEVVALHLAPLDYPVDYFVIASAGNKRQIDAVADEVELRLRTLTGATPNHIEGTSEDGWVLLDYGDVVVHVFSEERREYYDLEHLWSGASRVATDVPPAA